MSTVTHIAKLSVLLRYILQLVNAATIVLCKAATQRDESCFDRLSFNKKLRK
jgi:hypothetical protein